MYLRNEKTTVPRGPEANLLPAFPVSRPVAYVDVDYYTFADVQGDLKTPGNESNFSERDLFLHSVVAPYLIKWIL